GIPPDYPLGITVGPDGALWFTDTVANRIGRLDPNQPAGQPPGNGLCGIEISGGNGNTIGGTAAGAGNLIAFNQGNGVEVGSSPANVGNAILQNSIFSNTKLGID